MTSKEVHRVWPLIGRDEELRLLKSLLTGAGGPGVMLVGEAGVGKSRIAQEFTRIAEETSAYVVRVTGTESARHLPFAPLVHVLPADDGRGGESSRTREAQLARYAAALKLVAKNRRMAICVDDVHLLDSGSAALIQHIVVSHAPAVVVTARSGEQLPELIEALVAAGHLRVRKLSALSVESLSELAGLFLGELVGVDTRDDLAALAQGNVLFLRELVLGAIEKGSLHRDGAQWKAFGRIRPSDRLIELVEFRLNALPKSTRSLLELVAVGEPLGREEAYALGREEECATLVQLGLLSVTGNSPRAEVRLAHPIYGEVVRIRMPFMRRRELCRKLAQNLEVSGISRPGDALRLASLWAKAGGGKPNVLLAGAVSARRHYDFDLAEQLARSAIAAGAGFDAELLAAQVTWLQGRNEDAERLLDELERKSSDELQRFRVAMARLDNYLQAGRPGESLRIIEDAQENMNEPALRNLLAARRVAVLAESGGPETVADAIPSLLEQATGEALVWTCLAGGVSFPCLGKINAAIDITHRGYGAHLALSEPIEWYPWFHVLNRSRALTIAGRLEEAGELARAELLKGKADGSLEAQAFFSLQIARVLRERGRVASALAPATEAVALFKRLGGRRMHLDDSICDLARLLALNNFPTDARNALAEVDSSRPVAPYFATNYLNAQAWSQFASGQTLLARRSLEEAARVGAGTGDLVGATTALHDLLRFGFQRGTPLRLAVAACHIEGEMGSARALYARALMRADPQALLEASARFAAIGADLHAAEVAADAAVAWHKRLQRGRAVAALQRSAELADRCEGASTYLPGRPELRAALTPAEQEIALLAVGGSANRDIADELAVSPRSIENRLHRVYTKLGIGGRSDLKLLFAVAHG
jgi:DNA-binding CsgD family transcriptional regulator